MFTEDIKVGDVVLYFTEGINGPNTLSHSGKVIAIDTQGFATEISSKMGTYQVINHHPRDIPPSYVSTEPTDKDSDGIPTNHASILEKK